MDRARRDDPFRRLIPNFGENTVSKSSIVNGLSVDVEDWFQVGAFEKVIDRADWDSLEHRVANNTSAVLDLFAAADVKATFFTLGWVARRHPALMQRIVAEGHELASHGLDHARVFTLGAERFAADLSESRKILEDAGGVAIKGYRAPSFSIDTRTPWAHPILAEQGYDYSSSVAPIAHDHYGWRDAPRFAFRPLKDSSLIEIPVTTVEVAGRRQAAGGAASSACSPIGSANGRCAGSTGMTGAPASPISTRGRSTPASRAWRRLRPGRVYGIIRILTLWPLSSNGWCEIFSGVEWICWPGRRPRVRCLSSCRKRLKRDKRRSHERARPHTGPQQHECHDPPCRSARAR
jgi:polysaccharide deacetylase family protein (PEP-CTERM system associated)